MILNGIIIFICSLIFFKLVIDTFNEWSVLYIYNIIFSCNIINNDPDAIWNISLHMYNDQNIHIFNLLKYLLLINIHTK